MFTWGILAISMAPYTSNDDITNYYIQQKQW